MDAGFRYPFLLIAKELPTKLCELQWDHMHTNTHTQAYSHLLLKATNGPFQKEGQLAIFKITLKKNKDMSLL